MKQNHIGHLEKKLSIINGIGFKGERLVIPEVMRKKVLEPLHQANMGIEKTKDSKSNNFLATNQSLN